MRLKTPLLLLAVFGAALCQVVDYNPGVQNSPGLLSDQQRIPFATFYAACAAAASAHKTLAVTKVWTVATSATCSAGPVSFYGAGTIKPANGQTVTFTVGYAALSKICDISLGGKCLIGTPNNGVYPEWWGAIAGQDSTVAFQAMLNTVSGTANAILIDLATNNSGACYLISTTLTHDGTNGSVLSIIGASNSLGATGGACLQWSGASGGAITHFTNEFLARVEHVAFRGNALGKQLLWFDTSNDTFNTQNITVNDSSFGGMIGTGSAGLQLANSSCVNNNVSGIDVRNSQFVGNNSGLDTGILYYCGGNSKNLTVSGAATRFTNLGRGSKIVGSAGGWFKFDDVYWGANSIEDMELDVGHILIHGGDSEGSARIATIGGSGLPSSISFEGYSFASGIVGAAPSLCGGVAPAVVLCAASAIVDVRDSFFANNTTPTALPNIVITGLGNGSPASALRSFGNWYQNATSCNGPWNDGTGGGGPFQFGNYCNGYFTSNINQLPVESLGDSGGATFVRVPLPGYSPWQSRIFAPATPTADGYAPEITVNPNGTKAYFAWNAAISGCTNANPTICTTTNGSASTGSRLIAGFTGAWTALNGSHTATFVSATTFSLPIDATAFGSVTGTPTFNQISRVDLNTTWAAGSSCVQPFVLAETGSSANDALVATTPCIPNGGPIPDGTSFYIPQLLHTMSAAHSYNTLVINGVLSGGMPLNILTHFGTGGGGSGATAYVIGGALTVRFNASGYFVDPSQ